MSADRKKFYVTTPIYYVNARPHIGHAYTTIVADVLARRHRLLGDDTFFLTGTDEHGQKIERSAAAAGIPPQQFADDVSIQFRNLWDRMGLTYDRYIRTTDPKHKRGAQKLFAELYARGAIYLSSYTGQYCVSEEIFVEGPPGTIGPDGKPTETVTEENFFFRLSDYQLPLLNLIESDTLLITPESRKNEILGFLRGNVKEAREQRLEIATSAAGFEFVKGALRDLSVSRSSFTWGVPVPEPAASTTEKKHVMYVWLDALANYMTAIGYGSDDPKDIAEFARFWPADLHIMAKEITRQHCVYWPAFLLAAGLPLPKAITAHGWLLFDNSKMSKSKGNIVRTETILDAFGDNVYATQFPDSTKSERDLFASDVLRYFLLREIPFGQDGSFSFDALLTRYNADLAKGYANTFSRITGLISQNFEDQVPDAGQALDMTLHVTDFMDGDIWRSVWLGPEPGNPPVSHTAVARDGSVSHPRVVNELLQDAVAREFKSCRFSRVTELLMDACRSVDLHISNEKPWELAKLGTTDSQERLRRTMAWNAESIRIITALLYPVMPYATTRVWAQLGLDPADLTTNHQSLTTWGQLKPGTKLGPLSPIFPRADKSLIEIMTNMEEQNAPTTPTPAAEPTDTTHPAAGPRPIHELSAALPVGGSTALSTGPDPMPPLAPVPLVSSSISIDDFAKIELRVAQIVVAERIPKADKLLRLEVDLGPDFPRRQILSGIAEHYTPEELIGRRIVVITNLAPRKMRGLESHGMLLAASAGENGKPILATFAEDIALGSRLK